MQIALARKSSAGVTAARGDWARAEALVHEALTSGPSNDLLLWVPQTFDALAEIAACLDSHEDAARTLGIATARAPTWASKRWAPTMPRVLRGSSTRSANRSARTPTSTPTTRAASSRSTRPSPGSAARARRTQAPGARLGEPHPHRAACRRPRRRRAHHPRDRRADVHLPQHRQSAPLPHLRQARDRHPVRTGSRSDASGPQLLAQTT